MSIAVRHDIAYLIIFVMAVAAFAAAYFQRSRRRARRLSSNRIDIGAGRREP
ncbi:hypothetical protein [Sphingomonas parva]|uniref:hypothetical protein n=1 Tax=Sphingomonas parva TaxID=2555898 RepID=UPI0014311F2A|nr:hypothetical protein [Sphingomonas parva]